ncbi:MAG: DNA-directed RNA polymerase subunit F [Candidatus Micrarchaeia archaeon]
MIGKGANEIRAVTLSEVEKILEKRQGTAGEFGFEQQNALEYARRFARLKPSDAAEMQKELEELGLKTETAVKVVDLLPPNKGMLSLVMAKDRSDVPDKTVSKIEELVAKFSKKAKKIEPKVEVVAEAAPAEAAAPAKEEDAKKEEKKD